MNWAVRYNSRMNRTSNYVLRVTTISLVFCLIAAASLEGAPRFERTLQSLNNQNAENTGKSSLYVPFENTVSEHPVYWNEVIGTGSTKKYLGFTEGCEGQSICGFASFEKYTYPNAVYLGAVKNFEKDQTREAIPLSDGSLSQFSPSQCGLNCSSAYLSWFGEGGEVFFRVGSQANGSEIVSELTRAANSFIVYNSEE